MVDITLITGTTWVTPGDWNAADNNIHTIAGGGGGGGGSNETAGENAGGGGGAGGGGEFRGVANQASSGTRNIQIGASGS